MPTSEYERFRRRLEQQLRADFELLLAGYRAKLHAFETVARLRGELGTEDGEDAWPALEMPANLLPAAAGGELPAGRAALPPGATALPAGGVATPAGGSPPSPGGGALPPGAPVAAPAPAPAVPARQRTAFNEIRDLVDEALLRVGEVFDRDELCRAIGCVPKRTTLYRALQDLEWGGVLEVHERGSGRIPTRYRKLKPARPAQTPEEPRDADEPG